MRIDGTKIMKTAITLAIALLASLSTATDWKAAVKTDNQGVFDYRNASVSMVAVDLSYASGLVIVLHPAIKDKRVFFTTGKAPAAVSHALAAFEAQVGLMGFLMSLSNGIVTVDLKKDPPVIIYAEEQVIDYIHLQHRGARDVSIAIASATTLSWAQVLQYQAGGVQYTPAAVSYYQNVLIVRGTRPQIEYIRLVASYIDLAPTQYECRVYRLEYALALDLGRTLSQSLLGFNVTVSYYAPTNCLIVVAPTASFVQVNTVVRALDAPGWQKVGGVYILPVNNRQAMTVSELIKQAYGRN